MSRPGQRLFDLLLGAPALLLLAPLGLVIAGAVALSSPGPVLFRQERVGRQGASFLLLKFRTMRAAGAGPLVTASDDPRITPLGRWLRRAKLDEIPQLWNVLRGEMSLVGPRPEIPEIVASYDAEQRRVLRHRPGLVDPASLAFCREEELLRGSPDPERLYREQIMPRKLRLSRRYAERATIGRDLALLLRTPCAIGRGRRAQRLAGRIAP